MAERDEHTLSLRDAARAFLDEAFDALRADCVIPTPRWHPFVSVGVDYFGPDMMELRSFQLFSDAIEAVAPARFRSLDAGAVHPEFANTYVFRFLEAVIARAGTSRDYDSSGEAAQRSINELHGVLRAEETQVCCCRTVRFLTTADGAPIVIDDVTVIPEDAAGPRSFERMIGQRIPGADATFRRDPPFAYGPPHSMLVIAAASRQGDSPEEAALRMSARLDRLLLSAHLFAGWTASAGYEVQGPVSLISHMRPSLRVYGNQVLPRVAHRAGTITAEAVDAIIAIEQLVAGADVKRSGMATTSIDTALRNLERSYSADNAFTAIVDLATAQEAALLGGDSDNDAVTARLRSRAAALLVTDHDPARAIYHDLGNLYSLRSKLVHGGQVKRHDLEKTVQKLSTAPPRAAALLGIGMEYAVDRMRDLTRRALLARLCLGTGDTNLWPLSGASVAVDAELADESTRRLWRDTWRGHLATLGAASAANPTSPLEGLLG
jgi:hypothetical protein